MSVPAPASRPVLHLLLGSEADALSDCSAFCAPGDTVVLLAAGTLALARPDWSQAFPPGVTLCCLRPDALAHGLVPETESQQVTLLDDAGLVGLVRDCPHCLTWA